MSYEGSLLLELKILQHEVIKNLKFKPAGTLRRVDWYLRLNITEDLNIQLQRSENIKFWIKIFLVVAY